VRGQGLKKDEAILLKKEKEKPKKKKRGEMGVFNRVQMVAQGEKGGIVQRGHESHLGSRRENYG